MRLPHMHVLCLRFCDAHEYTASAFILCMHITRSWDLHSWPDLHEQRQ